MNPVDLWVLGLFQGDSGADGLACLYAVGVTTFMRLGRLYEQAGGLVGDVNPWSAAA